MSELVNDDKPQEEVAQVPAKVEVVEVNKASAYILWALYLFFPIIGIVYAYIKKSSAKDDFERSHCTYAIRTFWWGFLWLAIGLVTSLFVVGFLVLLAACSWYLYRVIKGIVRATEGAVI